MNILVAGGMGFIGSNLCRLLADRGIEHSVVDLKAGTDICRVDASSFDVIVLLAANLNHNMPMYLHNLAIYQWAARQNAHIIYTSSAAVYGDSKIAHLENEATPAPTLYGKSKLLGETIIRDTQKDYTILRLGNVYGSGDGNGAIDIFLRGGNKIYGAGHDVRDYVSVQTVAKAILGVVSDLKRHSRTIYNISSNVPRTTNDVYAQFGTGRPMHVPARGFDVEYSLLSNKKAIEAGLI